MLPAGPAICADRVVWDVGEQGQALLAVLFPHLAGLRVHRVEDRGDAVVICASSRPGQARCPRCGLASSRVHGGYTRMVADGAAGGRPVLIAVRARRFRCREPSCAVVTFAEQADGVSARYRALGLGHAAAAQATAASGQAQRAADGRSCRRSAVGMKRSPGY